MQPGQAEPDDAELLRRVAQQNIESFQAFYERYAARVTSYVRQLSRDREQVEDVVQEVFITVWRKAASFRPERGDAAGWLYTMTRNKLVDQWRRSGEGAEVEGLELAEVPAFPAAGDLHLSLRQALDQVAPEQRRAIEMAYFGGLTYEETAVRLKLPVGTLKSRIRTGLRTLRTVLETR